MDLAHVDEKLAAICPNCHKAVDSINAISRYDKWFHADCHDAWFGKISSAELDWIKNGPKEIIGTIPRQPTVDFGDLIEKLVTATLKLFKLKDRQAELVAERKRDLSENGIQGEASWEADAELGDLAAQDIELCKARGELKRQINQALGGIGHDGVKLYGK